ncbi:hypothetical protein FAI40_05925 [Acetobacteraceae bacterium]|nr:hypothetical protein FAI40_05925 [Acetobacteraceae bacterium]
MSRLFKSVSKTASLFAFALLLPALPHHGLAQTYINEDSTTADMDDDSAGKEQQNFRNEHYNDLIANLEISVQALESAQQMGQSSEAIHDKRKMVKKYLKLMDKQIEDVSELDDQSERVENELQQMRQSKKAAEEALEDQEAEDY